MGRQVDTAKDPLLELLLDVRTVFNPGSALSLTLEAALQDVGRQAAVAWVALPEADGGLVIEHVLGQRTDELDGLDVGTGQGLTGHVFDRARVHWVDEYIAAASITHEFDTVIEAERIQRMIAAPLTVGSSVLGVLSIGRRDAGEFGDATIARVEALAERASCALGIARAARDNASAAALAERRRISEDLHDGVGALLFSLLSRTDRLQRCLDRAELVDEMASLQAELGQVSSMVSSMVSQWHADASQDVQAEVKGIVEDFERRSGVQATAVFLGTIPRLDGDRVQAVTRLVGVALSNVERHATARWASVTVSGMPGELTVAVVNDGPSPVVVVPGVGLGGAEDRIARLGGSLRHASDEDGTGFTVRARIPL